MYNTVHLSIGTAIDCQGSDAESQQLSGLLLSQAITDERYRHTQCSTKIHLKAFSHMPQAPRGWWLANPCVCVCVCARAAQTDFSSVQTAPRLTPPPPAMPSQNVCTWLNCTIPHVWSVTNCLRPLSRGKPSFHGIASRACCQGRRKRRL